MAKSEGTRPGASAESGEDVKSVAKAGPAGVLPIAVIILALLAIVIFGIMLLVRG